jgi:hypothetical protein
MIAIENEEATKTWRGLTLLIVELPDGGPS